MTTNGWVNILGIERVWDVPIVITSVSFMIWVIPIQPAYTLPWRILIWQKNKQDDEDARIEYYRSMSMYNIKNALTEKSLPLSDNIHGPYKMMPPELLHTSGSGLIMYMFESLRDQMGGGEDRDLIDRQHILIPNLIKRQMWMWFSMRITEKWSYWWNKMSVFRTKGKLFWLLCIAHTTNGSRVMKRSLKYSDAKWKQYIEFLKQHLCMEEWFHDSNNKVEVINTQLLIAKVLQSLHQFFPRNTNTNEYNLPKMHGIT